MNMNAISAFPFRPHWSPEALADAVPLRLRDLFAPGAVQPRACNQARITPRPRPLRAGYRAPAPLPSRFLIG
jgi:hypothetical protein